MEAIEREYHEPLEYESSGHRDFGSPEEVATARVIYRNETVKAIHLEVANDGELEPVELRELIRWLQRLEATI